MAMTREQLSELLSAYLDGEVDSREKALVENTLHADPAARRLLDELRQTAAVVGALPRHAAPPNLALELDAQLERAQLLSGFQSDEERSQLRTTTWGASLRAAAMLAFVLGAGWWFLARQQEPLSSKLAKVPASDSKEFAKDAKSLTSGSSVPTSGTMMAESLIASGADPVLLVKQSFEPEPIRLRVVAHDATERDELSKGLIAQLASANTENLAERGSARDKTQAVGAFYLEGKAGINYSNNRDRQILVRVPSAQAQRIVDGVRAGGKVPADQIALQVGPAVVQGPERAQGMLQMMSEKDQSASLHRGVKADVPTDTRGSSTSAKSGLLETLSEIVGLGPVIQKSETDQPGDRMAAAKSNESGEKEKPSEYRSLVSKRLEVARSTKRTDEAGASMDDSETKLRALPSSDSSILSPGMAAADQFITMVVEIVIPDSKPPVRTNTGRNRS